MIIEDDCRSRDIGTGDGIRMIDSEIAAGDGM